MPHTLGIDSIYDGASHESTLKLSHLSLCSFDQLLPSFTVFSGIAVLAEEVIRITVAIQLKIHFLTWKGLLKTAPHVKTFEASLNVAQFC